MNSLWSRRSMIVFFGLGFGVPWTTWSIATFGNLPASPLKTFLFYCGDFMTVAGLVATWVAGGSPALKALLTRVVRVRAHLGWILFALFIPLLWLGIPAIVRGIRAGGIGPIEPAGLLTYLAPATLMALLTGPLGEEAGWRGYFLPRLLTRYSAVAASVILGVIWGFWHFPLYAKSVFATLPTGASFTLHTVCFAILMTVLWASTGGSIFWAIVLHYTVNVTPGVIGSVFPKIPAEVRDVDPLEIGLLVALTIVTVALVRPGRLADRVREVVGRLGPESIDRDRGGSS